MGTEFLRKIILEELRKVLKEEVEYPDRELDLGTTTFVGKRPSGAIRALQNDLNATGRHNLVTDGIPGSNTIRAVKKEIAWRGTTQDLMKQLSSKEGMLRIRGMLRGAISDYARQKADQATTTASRALEISTQRDQERAAPAPQPAPQQQDDDTLQRMDKESEENLRKFQNKPMYRPPIQKKPFGNP